MKKIVLLFVAICLLLTVGCSSETDSIAEIKKRGALIVGVKSDVPNFGYLNPETGAYEGLEIDLARALAKFLLSDENAVKFIPVTSLTRGTLLDNHEIDLAIATFTITEERKNLYHFSAPYYTDEICFMVKKDSGIYSLEDLEDKRIGAAFSSTAYDSLDKEYVTKRVGFTKKGFASYPEIKDALVADFVDVFAGDRSILLGYLDENLVILEEGFDPQQYGIATKLSNKALSNYVDSHFQVMKNDGTYEEIMERWLPQ